MPYKSSKRSKDLFSRRRWWWCLDYLPGRIWDEVCAQCGVKHSLKWAMSIFSFGGENRGALILVSTLMLDGVEILMMIIIQNDNGHHNNDYYSDPTVPWWLRQKKTTIIFFLGTYALILTCSSPALKICTVFWFSIFKTILLLFLQGSRMDQSCEPILLG